MEKSIFLASQITSEVYEGDDNLIGIYRLGKETDGSLLCATVLKIGNRYFALDFVKSEFIEIDKRLFENIKANNRVIEIILGAGAAVPKVIPTSTKIKDG